MISIPIKHFLKTRTLLINLGLFAGLLSGFVWFNQSQKPRVWRVNELPVAFWAWQNDTPNQLEVQGAIQSLNASALFIRAGQIDYEKLKLRRIREPQGKLPRGIDLHLVYNATRSMLSEFETLKIDELAETIASAFQNDCKRARREGVLVVGLQLDFDVPTRLLSHYAKLIQTLREKLKSNAQVSITGLPTWMASADLLKVLQEVSFWIPQFYGAAIPERLDIITPIASPDLIATYIEKVRKLKRPYYAGLAAYGYAVHYSRLGKMIEVRGDLAPTLVANDARLGLMERRRFDSDDKSSEWRYVYRARTDAEIDGLMMRAGESLMLDVPSIDSLKICVQTVRERGGEKLLGLCIFRLPSADDATNLSLQEVQCALLDETTLPAAQITGLWNKKEQTLTLQIANSSAIATLMGEAVMRMDLPIYVGSIKEISSDQTLHCESLFADENQVRPCAERRANLLRFTANSFPANEKWQATIKFAIQLPDNLQTIISLQTTNNTQLHEKQMISINNQ
jgi:hypothetical protein